MGEAKRKNQRECPALHRTISAAECGQGRNTTIPCPADCPHNPFAPANYREQFGPMEARVIHKLMALLARKLTHAELREMLGSGETYDVHALHVWHLYGRGLIDEWITAGELRDWKNDERFLVDCFRTTRVALTEIQRIADDDSVIVRDLLQPELGEIRIIDTSFVRNALRFDTHLGWIYRVPGGWRSSGAAIEFAALGYRDAVETLEILLDHLGAPPGDRRQWLLENMMLLQEAITEIFKARSELSLRRTDTREVTREFEAKPAKLADLADELRRHPRMGPMDDPSGDYDGELLVPAESPGGPSQVVGRITIDDGIVRARALSMGRADQLRAFLLELEPKLRETDESVVDLSPESPARTSQPDLVPPVLVEDVGGMDFVSHRVAIDSGGQPMLGDQLTGRLLDQAVPLLDGLTPRQAAARPEMRARLVTLMKGQVKNLDRLRRRQGLDVDLTPQLQELGLDELVQPPPPVGGAPAATAEEERAPQPPIQPQLKGEKLLQRLRNQISRRREIDRQIDDHEEFFAAVEELPRADFSIEESQMLALAARFAVFALHPELPRNFLPDFDRMAAWYDEVYESVVTGHGNLKEQMLEAVAESFQPEVVGTVLDFTANAAGTVGGDVRDENKFEFILALCAVVREVSYWPWKR